MKFFMNPLSLLMAVLLIAGCQSPTPLSDSQNDQQGSYGDGEVASSSGIDGVYNGGDGYQPGAAGGDNAASNGDYYSNANYGQNVKGGPNAPAKDRVIYFSYDSSNIDSRAESIIQAHANYLKKNSRKRILLEGHTDNRGTREYNIALGERRAISLLKRFQALGVNVSQIRILSYGKEKPAVSGYTENEYKRNRRGVIQY